MVVGKIIKELRLERELSQEFLAKQIGVTTKAISFWENEINEPKATYIVRLAHFFGVSTDYLLGVEE